MISGNSSTAMMREMYFHASCLALAAPPRLDTKLPTVGVNRIKPKKVKARRKANKAAKLNRKVNRR